MQAKTRLEQNLSPKVQGILIITIIISCLVSLLKYIAYSHSHSMAIYSDAMESTLNIIVSIVALLIMRVSIKPANKKYPFGHNKAEYFSSIIEAILIIAAALVILHKVYLEATGAQNIFLFNNGLIFSVIACLLQGIWGYISLREAKKYNSIALSADSLHLLSDFATTIGIVIGLLVAHYTHYYMLDYIIAALVALHIAWQGYKMLLKSIGGLMDRSVDEQSYKKIKEIIATNAIGALEAHDLKTRVAGYLTFIEFHLVVNSDMSVKEAHNICDIVEEALKNSFDNSRITIHIEPQEEAKYNKNNKSIPIV